MVRLLARLALAILLAGVLVSIAAGGVWWYAHYHWDAAQAAVKDYHLDDARHHLRICLMFWPNDVDVQVLAARADRYDGNFDEAEKHLNKALKLGKGSNQKIQVEFLLMRVQRGEEDEVQRELIHYVENGYPEAPVILETLAIAYMRNLRGGVAYTCLSRWIQLAPSDYRPYDMRGWVQDKLADWENAIEDYSKALELNPDLPNTRLRVAELRLEHNKVKEAEAHLELLAKQFPERADVKARLGQCRFIQDKREEARSLLEEAERDMPDDAPVLIDLAQLDMQEGHWDKAESRLRHALSLDSTNAEARYNLAACLEHSGRAAEAEAAREQWRKDTALLQRVSKTIQSEAERPTRDPDRLSEVGAAMLGAKNIQVGLWWLHRALKFDPNHQPTHQALADYYERIGDKDKAALHRRQLKSAKEPAR